MLFDLEGKKALITGASGGIGKEIAKVLIEHNAEVCISGRNLEELNALNLPLTDREQIWPLFWQHRGGFFAAHCRCTKGEPNKWNLEQSNPIT